MDPILFFNIFIGFISILPVFGLIFMHKITAPKYYGLLLYGSMLITWAALIAGVLIEAKSKISGAEIPVSQQPSTEEIIRNLEVWVYIFPAITGAIGANLVSAFILKDRPNNEARRI